MPRAQHLMRGAALGTALIGGGALFHVWEPFPFLVAAVVVVAACAAPVLFVREDGHGRVFEGVRAYLQHSWKVFPPRSGRAQLPQSRTRLGGRSRAPAPSSSSTSRSGSGSRSGRRRRCSPPSRRATSSPRPARAFSATGSGSAAVIAAASVVYGLGLVLGGFGNEWQARYLPVIFVVAIAGGTVMTLAWGRFFKLMPPADRDISGWRRRRRGSGC